MRSDIVTRRHVPRLRAARSHESAPQAQRAAGRRSADPHARARPLLPEGAPAAPRTRRVLSEDRRRLHPDRDDLDRRPITSCKEFRASVGAQWPFLSDPERTVQKDLDIQEYTDPEHDPMIPHTLVLKPGLVIHSIYNGYWFWGRPSVDDLWHDLRAVSQRDPPRLGPQPPGPARGVGCGRSQALPRLSVRAPDRPLRVGGRPAAACPRSTSGRPCCRRGSPDRRASQNLNRGVAGAPGHRRPRRRCQRRSRRLCPRAAARLSRRSGSAARPGSGSRRPRRRLGRSCRTCG